MSLEQRNKLKYLHQLAHKHPVMTASLLDQVGIYPQLRYKYVRSGWLEKLGRGVFKANGASIKWQDALRALQQQLKLQVYAGAKSTFQLLGRSHYLGRVRIYVFHPKEEHIPLWFKKLDCLKKKDLVLYAGSPFKDWSLGIEEYECMEISSLERAAFEQFYLVGTKESFDESYKLLEGLTALRPKLIQALLEDCSSVKTKRLFLYVAEHLGYAWFRKLDLSTVDLGSGPRVIDKQGVYNSKYQLVVPDLG